MQNLSMTALVSHRTNPRLSIRYMGFLAYKLKKMNRRKTVFKFVFYRRGAALGHKNVQDMTKGEKTVFELLKECDYLTIAESAIRIGKTTKTVYRAIKGLKEKGYIVREGNDHNGYWKIVIDNGA